jgi:hypothetical protein
MGMAMQPERSRVYKDVMPVENAVNNHINAVPQHAHM